MAQPLVNRPVFRVAALPAAASAAGEFRSTAAGVWWSDGAEWHQLNGGGGGSGPALVATDLSYTAGVLTSVEETFATGPERTTTLTYTAGVLTEVEAVQGAATTTTTLSYTDGVLTGVTIT